MIDRSPSIVMSDWLRKIRFWQWTPLDIAQQLIRELDAGGYKIITKDETEQMLERPETGE
jgi:hypothetical protein